MIAALRIKGLRPIIAADYSPARRALAEKMGRTEAHAAVRELSGNVHSRRVADRQGCALK